MVSQLITVGGKQLQLSRPYEPAPGSTVDLIGRDEALRMITAAWMDPVEAQPFAPLLVGPPGVGKNEIAYEMARLQGKKLYILQGHDEVGVDDLACGCRVSDDVQKQVDYIASPLVSAMHEGEICFIDEIAKIRPRALALLVSVLDSRRYIDSNLLGERIYAKPGFRFLAATNTADLAANTMPEFLGSRLQPVIEISYPPRAEMSQILRTRFPRFGERLEELIACFWSLWRERDANKLPAPRDVLYVFSLAGNLAALGKNGDSRSVPREEEELPRPVRHISTHHLQQAFRQIFRPVARGA